MNVLLLFNFIILRHRQQKRLRIPGLHIGDHIFQLNQTANDSEDCSEDHFPCSTNDSVSNCIEILLNQKYARYREKVPMMTHIKKILHKSPKKGPNILLICIYTCVQR